MPYRPLSCPRRRNTGLYDHGDYRCGVVRSSVAVDLFMTRGSRSLGDSALTGTGSHLGRFTATCPHCVNFAADTSPERRGSERRMAICSSCSWRARLTTRPVRRESVTSASRAPSLVARAGSRAPRDHSPAARPSTSSRPLSRLRSRAPSTRSRSPSRRRNATAPVPTPGGGQETLCRRDPRGGGARRWRRRRRRGAGGGDAHGREGRRRPVSSVHQPAAGLWFRQPPISRCRLTRPGRVHGDCWRTAVLARLGARDGEESMEPRIDGTAFGSVTIDGAVFTHDVVIRLGGRWRSATRSCPSPSMALRTPSRRPRPSTSIRRGWSGC